MDEKIVKDSQGLVKELVNDTISRQAAIDAICRDGVRLERGGALMITISTAKQWAVDLLCDLPSAQLEEMREAGISRYGVAAWLDNMGYTKLAYAVMDKDRFPSVHPEKRTDKHTKMHACDLIDRQAAIDAIRASTSKYTGFMEMEMYTDDDAVEAIEALPSAQPERKKPVFKTGESVYHVSYADGTGGFEKTNGQKVRTKNE